MSRLLFFQLRIVALAFVFALVLMPISDALAQREQMSLPDPATFRAQPKRNCRRSFSAKSSSTAERGSGHHCRSYLRKISVRRAAQWTRAAIRHRCRSRRLSVARPLAHHAQTGMAGLDAAAGNDAAPAFLPRFMAGGPGDPMGARALYLGATIYRIVARISRRPSAAQSSGCFRLVDSGVIDLYDRVPAAPR